MSYISDELRQSVINQAKNICEYCLIHQDDSLYTHEVDHIIPEKHRGKTIIENLCLSCLPCNRYKGTDFASFDLETNEVSLLFNPRKDKWSEHFQLIDVQITPLTATGRVTVFVLKLNDEKRLNERRKLSEIERYPINLG